MSITTVFDPPLPSDSRETFNSKAFDTVAKLNSWSAEANQTSDDINYMVTSPGVVAIGSDLTGANTIGTVAAVAADVSAVAAIDADVSAVAANAADVSAVAANEANINAAVADLPSLAAKVSKTGDMMTGHLSVPAGASGAQVPRAQDIAGLVRAMAVGTASQSGGVPTGAIIEQGSGAGGEYVRFADGTQICWRQYDSGSPIVITTSVGSMYTSAVFSWTFPASFAATPTVVFDGAAVSDGRVLVTGDAAVTSSSAPFLVLSPFSTTATIRIRQLAIGRWF